MKPEYLGDGVYASYNERGQLVLTTGHHLETEADNIVYLEPKVLSALLKYVDKAKEQT